MNGTGITVRALRTQQADGVPVYAFFLPGAEVTRIADISRIGRDEANALKGFQRKEIRTHVNGIVEYLNSGPVLFPNAIILALAPEVEFKQSRGPAPAAIDEEFAQAGYLSLPVRPEGRRAAWIVDGQQRSLALARASNGKLPVPVVGFVSADLQTQREQFILVNKVKPLPRGLLNELLPEVGTVLPRDLAARKLPSELCYALNRDTASPFHALVRRESEPENDRAVVTDTALIDAIKDNLKPPLGALYQYRTDQGGDADAMYRALLLYWNAVRTAFPDAWSLPSQKSRLMHSAGIRAMARLMDPIMLRADSTSDPQAEVLASLRRIAPHCHWTEGTWEGLGWYWDEVQNTSRHISRLTDHLIRLDRELARSLR